MPKFPKKSLRKILLPSLVTLVTLAVFLIVASHIAQPELPLEPDVVDPQVAAKAAAAREFSVDSKNPLVIVQDVDYSKGKSARWYPKEEAPILHELVAQKKLPPVAERVGPEPCVLQGVEGNGKYGGTWIRIANSPNDVGIIRNRASYVRLVRWSPYGYPLKPHLAKSYTVSEDSKVFTFQLRKGVKWSDGYPFTANDVMYWWNHEIKDPLFGTTPPQIMVVRGKVGTVEKVNDYCIRFSFPEPNGLFLARLATWAGTALLESPAHYLKDYHPNEKLGNEEKIQAYMSSRNLANKMGVYRNIKLFTNPEHPRLWPWVYRTYKSNPPQTFVRNPYYFCVDTEGRQLPYIDRLLFEVKSSDMLGLSAANGEVSMQARHIRYDDYTHLMNQREKYNFDVYHWYPGDRSSWAISPNLNRRIDADDPVGEQRHALMNDKRFRQALSVAINRKQIIRAEYNGQTEPAQVAPGPASFFYEESLYKSYTQYDPDLANKLLDEIGLTRRDLEGFRTYPDGKSMVFYLNVCNFTGSSLGQFVIDDWAAVGIRTILRERSRRLFYTEKAALKHDFNVWGGNGEFIPLLAPRYFLPYRTESNFAIAFAKWYMRGGYYGNPAADRAHGCVEVPEGHPFREAIKIYESACAESDPVRQREIFRKVLKIAAENTWTINISTPPPVVGVVKNGFRNVPKRAVYSWDFQSPGNFGIETFYFDKSNDSPGAIAQMKQAITEPTLPPDAPATTGKSAGSAKGSGATMGKILKYGFLLLFLIAILMVAIRHPYIGRRLIIMVPTLIIISIVSFTIIQLPPGDFITTRIMQLQESGETADLQEIDELKDMFHLEESKPMRYLRWVGLRWFISFKEKDKGLLQGYMGRSMEDQRSVNEVVGDRILLTVLISLGTILFTWALAIPIGIYSAVKQYSITDYILTFLGFIGMCIPGFLLALLLMYVSGEFLGIPVSGLFSSVYGAQPEWDWPKILDLLKHIWVPVAVLGVGGTAGMIRVMRANLLDELKKPYVVTARAKGVRPLKLLLKYPVRMALNPFISGIGGIFPQLVSGGAIVAMVLSLPTVGPLLLTALMSEDMYLAGSMLMVLSLLGVIGTLVSDLLLLWLDPRIRMQ